ncbi:hypothetical protein VUR80DRAFT_7560 [Thermomyces stellatus]
MVAQRAALGSLHLTSRSSPALFLPPHAVRKELSQPTELSGRSAERQRAKIHRLMVAEWALSRREPAPPPGGTPGTKSRRINSCDTATPLRPIFSFSGAIPLLFCKPCALSSSILGLVLSGDPLSRGVLEFGHCHASAVGKGLWEDEGLSRSAELGRSRGCRCGVEAAESDRPPGEDLRSSRPGLGLAMSRSTNLPTWADALNPRDSQHLIREYHT